MNALTAKEAEAWTSEMLRVANITIREILEAADRNNIDRDSAVQFFANLFLTMTSVATFEHVDDECWDALKEHARQNHEERVAKNPDRIDYAIRQLEAHNIEYVLKNDVTGHFHCRRKSDNALVQFWAGTGKILGYTQRGIHNLIRICEEEIYHDGL